MFSLSFSTQRNGKTRKQDSIKNIKRSLVRHVSESPTGFRGLLDPTRVENLLGLQSVFPLTSSLGSSCLDTFAGQNRVIRPTAGDAAENVAGRRVRSGCSGTRYKRCVTHS